MKKVIHMLCPVCQGTGSATLECTDCDLELYVRPSAECPNCGTKMYQADEDMIPLLQYLNSKGVITQHHCSETHEGYTTLTANRQGKLKPYRGAYLMVQDTLEVFNVILVDVVNDFNRMHDDIDIAVEVEKTIQHGTHVAAFEQCRVTIRTYVLDNKLDTLRAACDALSDVVRSAMHKYETEHEEYKGFGRSQMAQIANNTRIEMFDAEIADARKKRKARIMPPMQSYARKDIGNAATASKDI